MTHQAYKKNIICLDPYESDWCRGKVNDGNGRHIEVYDTSLGNRIIHWASSYYMSTLYEGCKVIVDEKWWPELEFLDLPNTEVFDIDSNYIKNSCIRLSPQDIDDIINNKKQDIFENNSFPYYCDQYTDVGYEIISIGISKIKFKNEKVNEFFKNNFSNFCSIHLRRGLGSYATVGFIKGVLSYANKKKLDMYLQNYYFHNQHTLKLSSYNIIPDDVYFLVINGIISENKLQKFYISADIPETYYSYYFDRYPNNIENVKKYFQEFLSFFDYSIIKQLSNYLKTPRSHRYRKQILINLFDLFVLSHSHTLIGNTSSTWTRVASLMSEKKNIIHDGIARGGGLVDLIPYTLHRDSMSFSEFVKKYAYYRPKKSKSKGGFQK
jgi:hypothetical protein